MGGRDGTEKGRDGREGWMREREGWIGGSEEGRER